MPESTRTAIEGKQGAWRRGRAARATSRAGFVGVLLLIAAAAGIGVERRHARAARDQRHLATAREGARKFEQRYRGGNPLREASMGRRPWAKPFLRPGVPPSSVFLPNEEKLYPLEVPGTRTVNVADTHVQLVELRGWLRAVDRVCKASDPAWYYLLEADLSWSDAAGLRASDLLRVGNIAALGDLRQGPSPWQIESRPLIRIEFGGWDARKLRNPPPDDWQSRGAAGCPNVFFAFDPLRPAPGGPRLVPGAYVRVVGSLVSDAPHGTKAAGGVWLVRNLGLALAPEHVIHASENVWSDGGEENPDNPARWTEVHPADRIDPLPPRPQAETVRGVTVRRPSGLFSPTAKPMDLSLSPPGPRPTWARGIKVTETILDAARDSAFERSLASCRVTDAKEAVRVHIDLKPGAEAFASIFRVSWSPKGYSWSVVRPRAASQLARWTPAFGGSDSSPASRFGP